MRPLMAQSGDDTVNGNPNQSIAQTFSNTAVARPNRSRGIGSGSFGSLANTTSWFSQTNDPHHVMPYMESTRRTNLSWGDESTPRELPKSDTGSNYALNRSLFAMAA